MCSYNGIHICRREGETGIKPPLNFGEVVALDLGDGVDVLLAGHDDPSFAHALLTKFLGNGLEIEHQLGIIADVLPDFIHQKYNMVVVPLALDIALDALGEVLDADGIRLHRLFAPVPCRCLAHEIHRNKGIYHAVLDEVEVLPGVLPRIAVFFLKSSLKLIVAAFLGKPPSVSFSITFRAPDRTLTDDEVNKVMNDILDSLEKKFGAVLRDK